MTLSVQHVVFNLLKVVSAAELHVLAQCVKHPCSVELLDMSAKQHAYGIHFEQNLSNRNCEVSTNIIKDEFKEKSNLEYSVFFDLE